MSNATLLKHHLYWGLALGAAVALVTQILTWVGLGLSNLTWILPWLLVVVFALFAGKSLGRHLEKRPRFLQALFLLLVMILVGRLVYQTYMWIYINYVDPSWVDTVAEVWTAQLQDAGNTPAEINDKITRFRRLWQTDSVFTLGLLAYTMPQIILGLMAMILGVVQPWKKIVEDAD